MIQKVRASLFALQKVRASLFALQKVRASLFALQKVKQVGLFAPQKVENSLFLLSVFFLPFQVGKHFWPKFSYIDGIRVDYISPTLHLFDITIVLLFLVYLFRLFKTDWFKKTRKARLIFVLFVFYLLSIFTFSKSFELHFFGLINLFEAGFLGFYVSQNFKKKDLTSLIVVLSISSIIISLISIGEFLKQESMNGLFYFLGERSFNYSTIGIATFEFAGGKLLRPYSTFPHPNVLSFFLLLSFVINSLDFTLRELNKKTFLVLISLVLSSGVILMSFSRVAIFLYVLFAAIFIYRSNVVYKKIFLSFLFMFTALFILFFSSRFIGMGLTKDLGDREEIAKTTFSIIQNNPLFGTGINNYFIYEADLQKKITPTFLQPVHNVYLLAVVEIGLVGLGFVLYFSFLTIKALVKRVSYKSGMENSFYSRLLFLFFGILFIGIFDHFMLTLPQGLLFSALIIGLSWTNWKS